MSKWQNSMWGERRKIKKYKECGGQVWEYAPMGMLGSVKKCYRCGSDGSGL